MTCPHSLPKFWEPLCYVGGVGKVQFGRIASCSQCRRPLGDPQIFRADPTLEAIVKKWAATSWTLMLDHNKGRDGAPLNFVAGKTCLVPEGYTPPQIELDEEVPF